MAKNTQQKDTEIEVDRRATAQRRDSEGRREKEAPVAEERRGSERRKVARRRQIDPTTCERDYSNDEIEFMHALDEYKRANGRMFPTCSEILEVVRKLGYEKLNPADPSPLIESDPTDDISFSDDLLMETM